MSEYTFVNHTGTHVAAPAHQIAGGWTLDDIPLDHLVTEGLTIDLSARQPGPVGLEELGRHLPEVRRNDLVLFRSDNARNWGTDAYWHGWSYPDAAAAQALIDDCELHYVWLSAGAVILENLAALDQLPPHCRIVVAPLKVKAANGGPARAFALLD